MAKVKKVSGKKQEVVSERRRYARISPPKPIKIKYRFVKGDNDSAASSEDALSSSVSGGGLFIELPDLDSEIVGALLKGEKKLSLAIEIPNIAKPVKALGQVIWMEGRKEGDRHFYSAGVSFLRIDEDDRNDLMNYIIGLCLQENKSGK